MAELEADLEKLFYRLVQSRGGWAVKLSAPAMPGRAYGASNGLPDRMVLWPGGTVDLVELKTSRGKLSAKQKDWHLRAAGLGTFVWTLYGEAHIREWVAFASR